VLETEDGVSSSRDEFLEIHRSLDPLECDLVLAGIVPERVTTSANEQGRNRVPSYFDRSLDDSDVVSFERDDTVANEVGTDREFDRTTTSGFRMLKFLRIGEDVERLREFDAVLLRSRRGVGLVDVGNESFELADET
jgi:hypothetical protein